MEGKFNKNLAMKPAINRNNHCAGANLRVRPGGYPDEKIIPHTQTSRQNDPGRHTGLLLQDISKLFTNLQLYTCVDNRSDFFNTAFDHIP